MTDEIGKCLWTNMSTRSSEERPRRRRANFHIIIFLNAVFTFINQTHKIHTSSVGSICWQKHIFEWCAVDLLSKNLLNTRHVASLNSICCILRTYICTSKANCFCAKNIRCEKIFQLVRRSARETNFSLYLLWFIEKSVAVSRQFMGYNMIPLCIARNSYNNLLFVHRQMCYS